MNPFSMMMSGVGAMAAIVTFGVQMGGGFMVMSAANTMTESSVNPFKGLVVEGPVKQNGRYVDAFRAMKSPTDFNSQRFIWVTTYVPTKVILKNNPDVSPIDETSVEIVAQVWAGQYAQKECERVMKQLASKCRVASVSAAVKKGRRVRAHFKMEYVGQHDAPTYDSSKKYLFNTISRSLLFKKKSGSVSWRSAESKRSKLYRKVARLCSKIRKEYGTCESSRLFIAMEPKRRSRSYKQSARVTLSWLKENGPIAVASN